MRFVITLGCILVLSLGILAQRVAIVAPERAAHDLSYVSDLSRHFGSRIRLLDPDLADTAFRSTTIESPFNMTVSEARTVSSVIGCEYLLIVRSGEQRRTALSRSDYFEAFAFLFLIDGRSGELVRWQRVSFEAGTQLGASGELTRALPDTADLIVKTISDHRTTPKIPPAHIEEVPAEGSARAVGLKPPIPYRRFRPEYTETAFLYGVRATVDAEADVGVDGSIIAVRFVRWAGFGLEESVEKAIRQMNWRPAMRNTTPLPMRILLRYNFTKVDKK
jgi:hypothetical protein